MIDSDLSGVSITALTVTMRTQVTPAQMTTGICAARPALLRAMPGVEALPCAAPTTPHAAWRLMALPSAVRH